jgi:hypothetical protein
MASAGIEPSFPSLDLGNSGVLHFQKASLVSSVLSSDDLGTTPLIQQGKLRRIVMFIAVFATAALLIAAVVLVAVPRMRRHSIIQPGQQPAAQH